MFLDEVPCYLRDLGGYSVIYRVAQHKQGVLVICTYKVTNSSNNTHSQVYEGGLTSCIHKKCRVLPRGFPGGEGAFGL